MKIRLNWGFGVTCGYALFALSTAGFVVFAMNQQVDLVSPDYYAESLQQDAHADAARRAEALGERVSIDVGARAVEVRIPEELVSTAKGTIRFYRPSNAAADRVVPLALDKTGLQRAPLDGLAPGAWRVKLEWTASGLAYYVEQPMWVP